MFNIGHILIYKDLKTNKQFIGIIREILIIKDSYYKDNVDSYIYRVDNPISTIEETILIHEKQVLECYSMYYKKL